MKLRKALDKAQQDRQGTSPLDRPVTTSSPTESKAASGNWTSPTYHESTPVALNPDLLEENRCVCMFPDSPEINFFKILRTQIQQALTANHWNTVMITSANPNEGKTLTSINLALTFSKTFNQTVLLIDCDLQQQSIQKYLGVPGKMGLIDHLYDDRQLNEIIVWPGIDKMTLISGGRTIKDSAEILSSPKMRSLVMEMKTRYSDRIILFDVPPVLSKADVIAFSPLVDCIIMVVEEGKTSMQDIKKAVALLPQEKFLGFVLNKKKSGLKELNNNPYQ
ncbi:MAG: tyrosine protein kinase [Desulfobacterium sp.]|nr:tyrosine protein kinase [Desulfobacterium sp.]